MENEIWKDIPGYEGIYQINEFGEVYMMKYKKIKKTYKNKKNYILIKLSKNNKEKTFGIHQLVACTFLNHSIDGMKKVVNHKDLNKNNNHKDNLEIISNRENCNKKHLKTSSVYTGVHYNKKNKNWIATVSVNGKSKYLGSFKNEKEASITYLNYLKLIQDENK